MEDKIARKLTVLLGNDEYGKELAIDFSTVKHLLVAGCTGSGKSVLLHKIIATLLENNSPQELKFIMVDPKIIELPVYNEVPHLLTPVITDQKKTVLALKWTAKEMSRRYDVFKENKCRSIQEYNGAEKMPRIVIVIDELSDSMQTYPKETEPAILKIAQMGHVAGIHLILSTSRPSTKVFTVSIRDAISARIAFQTASIQDSKVIVGIEDACKLRGAGDMLFRDGLKYPIHGQIDLISHDDVKSLCKRLQNTYKDYVPAEVAVSESSDETHDDLYDEACEAVVSAGAASTSYIQRKLGVGYSRAAQLMDMLESKGVIGPAQGSKPRRVIPESKN
ncbi:MAG: FtsK/SpoIIIE domain-containing protein [Candidatus Taylorbacteria bacterium]